MVKMDVRINCNALICIKYKGTEGNNYFCHRRGNLPEQNNRNSGRGKKKTREKQRRKGKCRIPKEMT